MPKVSYTAEMEIQREAVWAFVRDMNNWAPFARGYQGHEVVNDEESVWTVKGEIGPISRVTKFHINITRWVEGETVGFTVKGLNEPVTGEGAIRLSDGSGGGTDILGEATLEFGGNLGPILNHLIGPWVQSGADELVTKIAVALQPSYVRPSRPTFVARWARALWRLLTRPFRRGEAGPAPIAVEPVAVAGAETVEARERTAGLRLETILADITVGKYVGEGERRTSVERTAAAARQIEELGFDGLTTPEAGHDPFLPLAIAAEHTSRVSLGTNVAIAFPRSPMSVAQTAWDLQQLSAGRFKLGLGTQVKGHNERRYGTPWTGPPGPRLREYLLCLKAIFATFQNGTKPQYFEGEHYKFTMLPPFFNPGPIDHPHVPLYISGLNPYMARLAGELCDGLRLHPLATLPFTKEVVLPAIEAGARKAGRAVSDVDIVGSPFLVTGRDEGELEAGKRGAKQQIAFYSSTRTYHAVLEYHGWGEVGRKLHEMSLEGKWGEMAPLISDEMLDAFAVVAPLDELVPRVRERWGGVLDTLFLGLPPAAQEDESRLREIIEALKA